MQQNLSSEFKVLSRTTILRINEAHGAEPRRAERVTWLAFAFLQALAGRCACSLKGMHLQFKAHKLLTWCANGRILVVHRWMVICDLLYLIGSPWMEPLIQRSHSNGSILQEVQYLPPEARGGKRT
ncbi:hypothetical protein FOQG_02900 [Fusarium oxysporum f. sp. raphani 54005]|uniref:Uncharacterized protein n=3 Tax=Fusarium oxysporum TaxID=5507 RepID=X0CTU2_FUSOX|nr:hypothetical protein FOVG_07942 [Fusarium oxysporum f. sp. pisi HDV247]EXK97865.1 hypothetical protein FOQG_02900 [Fusarium oxysporum f. sp. raphani 54005]EXL77649.1 hypothetical protein FOPG_07991 [Fusarium oxysporum f. sp. conglutinans race 2 54008]